MKHFFVGIGSLFIFGCGSGNKIPSGLQGKWHQTEFVTFEFASNSSFTYEDSFDKRNIVKRSGTFRVDKEILSLKYDGIDGIFQHRFIIKDSVMLMIYPINETEMDRMKIPDSLYYHKNPYYTEYESEQLFKYGRIIDKDRRKPLPFIYFEF